MSETVEMLSLIRRNASEGLRLIGDLLDCERMATGKMNLEMEFQDLISVCEQTYESFVNAATSKGINLTFHKEAQPVEATFDPARIAQVIANLLSNAIKFTPPGGSVAISTRKVENGVIITVVDDGIGVPPEKYDEIFTQYSQLQNKDHRGLGLGLHIAKTIVEAHQGVIKLECGPDGKGSMFSVFLS
jgi:signal transduction histidine kinase